MEPKQKISYFEPTKVTAKGLALLSKLMLKGEPLKLTRAAIGDGVPSADPVTLTSLVHEVPSHQTGDEGTSAVVDIQYYTSPDNGGEIAMRVLVQNGDTEISLREVGIMANDPDEGEILYAYTVNRSKYVTILPAHIDGTHISVVINLKYYVSNLQSITANITLSAGVTLPEFLAHKSAESLDHPDGSVTHIKLAENSVWENNLGSQAVTNDKIANDAVSFNKLKDNAVITSKLADGAVTDEKIAGDSISHDKLKANSVWENNLGSQAVTNDKIANDAVTLEKLAPEVSEAWEKHDAEIVITVFSLFGGIRITYETWTDHDSPGSRTRITDAEYTTDTLTKLLPAIIVARSAQDSAGVFTTYTPGVYADKQGASFVVGIYDTFHSGESHLMKKPITDTGSGEKTIVIGTEE